MQAREEESATIIHEEKCSNNGADVSAPAVEMWK